MFLPNSPLGDFLRTIDRLLEQVSETAALYRAHRLDPVGFPIGGRVDLLALRDALHEIRGGSDASSLH